MSSIKDNMKGYYSEIMLGNMLFYSNKKSYTKHVGEYVRKNWARQVCNRQTCPNRRFMAWPARLGILQTGINYLSLECAYKRII